MLPGGVMEAEGLDVGTALHYGDPVSEARALEAGSGLIDFSQFDVLTVTGPERLTWLHRFVSQHVESLPAGTSTEALILDPAGHVEHGMAMIDDGATTWLLTDAARGEALARFLRSMMFASRVEVTERGDLAVLGVVNSRRTLRALLDVLAGAEAQWQDPWPTTTGTSYGPVDGAHPALGWDLRLFVVPRAHLAELAGSWTGAGGTLAGSLAAEAARIAAWRPRFGAEVDERTIPHELDWLRTAVHLEKGCYRGQETVARVVNLGKPPRRLVFLHLDGSAGELPAPGDAVRAGEAEVGRVTSTARHHELGPIALAVVRRSVHPAAQLTVSHEDTVIAANAEEIVAASGAAAATPAVRPGTGLRGSEARKPGYRTL